MKRLYGPKEGGSSLTANRKPCPAEGERPRALGGGASALEEVVQDFESWGMSAGLLFCPQVALWAER